jgi:hypothetical protein
VIVVEIKLRSSRGRDRDRDLGTMVIDNVTPVDGMLDGRRGDYRCRMYKKGDLKRHLNWPERLVALGKPIREGRVEGHRRLAEPVQNLVAKCLKAMGYE